MTTSIDDLLPCPFCGSQLVHHAPGQKGHQVWVHPEGVDCIARTLGIHSTDLERIAAWNRRSARQAVVPLEWQYYPDAFPPASDADTPFGRYSIEEGMSPNTEDPAWHSDSEPIWTVTFGSGYRLIGVFNSIEVAKSAAQADYTQCINSALAAPVRDEPRAADERGWLVEMQINNEPWWWAIDLPNEENWTKDSLKALRFGRREDAESFIRDAGWTEVVATEHMWSDPFPRKPEGETEYGLLEDRLPTPAGKTRVVDVHRASKPGKETP